MIFLRTDWIWLVFVDVGLVFHLGLGSWFFGLSDLDLGFLGLLDLSIGFLKDSRIIGFSKDFLDLVFLDFRILHYL